VGRFVEYFGPGLDHLTVADRATIANMRPEYLCHLWLLVRVDEQTLRSHFATGRSSAHVASCERLL